MLSVYVRDADYQRVAQFDTLTRLECVERHLGLGTWVLEMPFDGLAADLLVRTPGVGIQVRDDDRVVFAGPVRKVRREVAPDMDVLSVSGWDDTTALHARLVHPDPLTAGTEVTTFAQARDTHTGPASTVLRQFIDRNVGPSALVARRWPGLTLAADPANGPTVTVSGRWQNLLEHLTAVASPNGMTILARQEGSGVVVTVRASRDRTNIELSPRAGTLQGWTMEWSAPDVTAGYAGGQGELAARTIVQQTATPPAEWPWRIEQFSDYRNAENSAELQRSLSEMLVEGAAVTSLELVPAEGLAAQYGVDFDLGDRVTVVLDRVRSVETVTAATFKVEDGEPSRTFSVGPEQAAGLFRQVRRLGTQVRNLEGI